MAAYHDLMLRLFDIGAVKFGQFTLKSGIQSPIYIDLRVIVSFPDVLKAVADAMWDIVQDKAQPFKFVCGVPYTALPIATVMSVVHSVPMVMRRKEVKKYGTKSEIEGAGYQPGDGCLIVEDLVTSAASILETVAPLQAAGLKVSDAVVLIDRQQGGRANLQNNNITLHSVFKLDQFLGVLSAEGRINDATVAAVQAFLEQNSAVTAPAPAPAAPARRLLLEERLEKCSNSIAQRVFRSILSKRTNLCVAVDETSPERVLELARLLGPHICVLKTHVDILDSVPSSFGPTLLALAEEHNFLVFEDRKFADIGNTVKLQFTSGVFQMSSWCHITNAHGLPGDGVIDGLREGSRDQTGAVRHGLLLLAQMSSAGNLCTEQYAKSVVEMATRHPDFVCGFVSQSLLAPNSGLLHFTPGVKLAKGTDALGQQYNTPLTAVEQGADVIIVGRGVTDAKDPVAEALQYKEQGWQAYLQVVGATPK
eukprot:c5517_g1_i1.p1 GENE.c5517_g1_i1~~c5517_g1_i1.p1  ORF type:complete len:489 (+),score=126.17 c5517_g1_i1:31-1467(+)